MKRTERQTAIRAELEQHPERSDREIARRLGCDHKTVAAMRRKLAAVIRQKVEIPQRKETINMQSQPMKTPEPMKDVKEYEPLPEGWEEFFMKFPDGHIEVPRRQKSTPATAQPERRVVRMGPLPRRDAVSEGLRRCQQIQMRRAAEEREREKQQRSRAYAVEIMALNSSNS